MAYEPTVWACGDEITAEKLNKLEQGVANSGGGSEPLIVRFDHYDETIPTSVYDKTWQEVDDALANGRPCYVYRLDDREASEDFVRVLYPIAGTRITANGSYYADCMILSGAGVDQYSFCAITADSYLCDFCEIPK